MSRPDWKREIRRRLAGARLDPGRAAAIEEELAQHLEDRHADLRAAGSTEVEAERAVLAELDADDRLVAEVSRLARPAAETAIVPGAPRGRLLSDLVADLHYAVRSLARQPGFTAVAVLALAIGIGGTTAMFSLVNGILLRQLPFRDPERLVWVSSRRVDPGKRPFNLPDFADLRDRNRSLDGIAAFATWSATITNDGDPARVSGTRISAGVFELLGVQAAIGRVLLPADDTPGREQVVVMTDGLWRRRFGADPALVGRTLTLNGAPYTVVGVLPPEFFFPIRDAELAIPLTPDADPWRAVRGSVNFLRAVARVKPDVTIAQAQADLDAIVAWSRRTFPVENAQKLGVTLAPLHEEVVGDFRLALWVLLGAVGTVLMITCVNLANLALVRAAGRRREMAIRTALGASRTRLIRQLATESLLLAGTGGGAGLLLAVHGIPLLIALGPVTLPRVAEIGVDLRVLLFTFGLSILSGLAAGLAPAWRATRVNLDEVLREAARGSSGGRLQGRARGALVVAEVALSLVLLVGAGLLVRSFLRLQAVDPGFEADRVLAARLSLPPNPYPDRFAINAFAERLQARLETLPGVAQVGCVTTLPLSGTVASIPFAIEGRAASPDEALVADYAVATAGYFGALGIPLIEGRLFEAHDRPEGDPIAVVSRSLARRFWPDGSPVGARLLVNDNDVGPRPVTIVGVVGDVRPISLDGEPSLHVYLPLAQAPQDGASWLRSNQYWVLRTALEPLALQAAVRDAIHAIDRDAPASDLRSMQQYLAASVAPRRFNLWLLTVFAGAALVLAATGLYGVIAYAVAQRRHEIGIRMTLGAGTRDVLRLVLGEGLRLALAGVAVGLAGALALSRLMTSLLFEVSASDPATFGSIALLLVAVALVACWLPARRAMRVDPLVALRSE